MNNLLNKVSKNLFTEQIEQAKFIDAVLNPQPLNPCILWCQPKPEINPFTTIAPLPWQPTFTDRLELTEKPGKHPFHQSGYYYCLDLSSIFAASVLLAIPQPVDMIIDMCASPGGKSIFAWQALAPKTLICNEVIGKRIGMLSSNLKRCQIEAKILNKDPEILANLYNNTANLVIVDAPCSGQSLLAKGEKVPGCFHPVNINKCANRQKRIIANSAKLVAPQGYLAYMTCTYSIEENEQVATWLMAKFPQFQPVEIPQLKDYRSNLVPFPCYRIWPQSRLGAGAFTVLWQNIPA